MKIYVTIISVIATALLILTGCTGKDSGKAKEFPVPPDANLLMSLRLGDILSDSDLVGLANNLLSQTGQAITLEDLLQEALAEGGVDLRAIDRITLAGDVESDANFVAMMEGGFQEEEFLAALEREGDITTETYKRYELHINAAEDVSFVFLASDEVLFGGPTAIRNSLDIIEGDAEPLKGVLRDAFDNLGDPLVKLTVALPEGTFDGEEFDLGIPGLSAGLFTDIQSVSISVDKRGSTIDTVSSLGYATAEIAQKSAEAFNGLLSFAKGFIDDPQTADFFDSIKIEGSGSALKVSYSATIQEIRDSLSTFTELFGDFSEEGLGDLFP